MKAHHLAMEAELALETGDVDGMLMRCAAAIEIHPMCVDANLLLVEHLPMKMAERVKVIAGVIEGNLDELGREFIETHQGDFWSHPRSKPILRAMGHLASTIAESEKTKDFRAAIDILEAMLELDYDDNIGARRSMAAWLMALRDWDAAEQTLTRFEGCDTVEFAWVRLMLAFVRGGPQAAAPLIEQTIERNTQLVPYMVGDKPRPTEDMGEARPGNAGEAAVAADMLAPALRALPKFRSWLRKHLATLRDDESAGSDRS